MLNIKDIMYRAALLAPGESLRITFTSGSAAKLFRRRFASYKATAQTKAYRLPPDDPSYGISPFANLQCRETSKGTIEITNSEEIGISSIEKIEKEYE
jgi:hypothetical protein